MPGGDQSSRIEKTTQAKRAFGAGYRKSSPDFGLPIEQGNHGLLDLGLSADNLMLSGVQPREFGVDRHQLAASVIVAKSPQLLVRTKYAFLQTRPFSIESRVFSLKTG